MKSRLFLCVSAALLAVTACVDSTVAPPDATAVTLGQFRTRGSTVIAEAESLSQAFRDAANAILPSVVKIHTTVKGGSELMVFRGLGIPIEAPEQEGLGSGVIIDSEGVVLTNNHVVKSADTVIVELRDGTELYATEYVTDPLTDLAIVRVRPAEPLPAARFGDSDELQIGDWVLAVGHPLDLDTSVSAGIISAKGRSLGERVPRARFLQTDAAINPGNSGGPLVNLRGEIVGINTAIASQTGGYQGIGFAVPGNLAQDVQAQLSTNGEVRRGYLGVATQEMTQDLARQLLNRSGVTGVVVTHVGEGTPADRGGVRPGDVITRFGNQPVDSLSTLQRAVEKVPVGSPQRLDLMRQGKPMSVNVNTLSYGNDRIRSDFRGQVKKLTIPTRSNSSLGFEVGSLRELARRRGYDVADAVVITRVDRDGIAAEEGIEPGWIILQVRDRKVSSTDEFIAALRDESLSDGVLLLVRDTSDNGFDKFVVLQAK